MSGLPVGPRRRELVGDNLKGKPVPKTCLVPERLFPCFKPLFQGDHLGVEFALRSHEVLLQQHGLLDRHTRVEGHRNFPAGSRWDALVIDDYFCLGSERLNAPPVAVLHPRASSVPTKPTSPTNSWVPLRKTFGPKLA